MKLHFLLDATFQSNPKYAVTEWSYLNQSEQKALAGLLTNGSEIFGVFKPVAPDSGLSIKLAYKDVALLFYFLQQPDHLPNYIKQNYDDEMNMVLAKLIMEEVLQMKYNENFVSGTAALRLLYKDMNHGQPASKHIEALSKKAIEYVVQLNHVDLGSVLSRLYCYNTIPAIGKSAFNIVEQVEHFIGITNKSPLEKELLQHWNKHLPNDKFPWLTFTRKRNEYRRSKKNVTYKIYVSPLPDSFPEVYEKTVTLLSSTNAFSFKTGTHQRGLLRPDKFVIYFYNHKDLEAAALLLKEELKAYPAQGVPFTAQLDDTGLLSWGIDPPGDDVLETEGGSWRAHIAEKLAVAVLQAKAAQLAKKDAYDYIINKIFLEKINPFTWMPQQNMWS